MIRGKIDFLSVSELACDSEEYFIMLKAFYDASNKVHVKSDRFVTLAGVISTVPIWRQLETKWLDVLRDNNAPVYTDETGLSTPYFHSREAIHKIGGYKRFGKKKVRILIRGLTKMLSDFQYADTPFKDQLVCVTCTIDRNAYIQAANDRPYLPTMAKICVNHCVGIVMRLEQSLYGVSLNFDSSDKIGEPYFDVVDKHIHRTGKYRPSWANRVRHHGYIDNMRKCPAVQVADLLAWSANRFCKCGASDKWCEVYLNTAFHSRSFHLLYDTESFSMVFDSLGRHRRNAKAPLLPTGVNALKYVAEMTS